MNSSQSEDCFSDTLAQFEEECANYKHNCIELEELFYKKRSYLGRKHSIFAKNVKNTVDKTFPMIYEAEELMNKAESLNSLRRLYHKISQSGKQQKALEILMKKLKENDDKVKEQTHKVRHESKNNTAPGDEGPSIEVFLHETTTIAKTIPFTEPYDEDLCDFETIDC